MSTREKDRARWIRVPVFAINLVHPEYSGSQMLAHAFGGRMMRVSHATRVEDLQPEGFREAARQMCDSEYLWQIHPDDAVAAGFQLGIIMWTCCHCIEAD